MHTTAVQRDGTRPPIQTMIRFTEDHRADHGVPICRVPPIAPATFYDHLAKRAGPSRLSDRAKRDEDLKPEIKHVFAGNLSASMAFARSGIKCAAKALISHAARSHG